MSTGTSANNLPPIRRILVEDYPSSVTVTNNICPTDWFQKPQYIINNFMYYMYNILNGGVTFQTNIASQLETITITTGSAYTSGTFTPIQFAKTINTKAINCTISQITNETNSNYTVITGAVGCPDWQDLGNGTMQINFVSGLANNSSYSATILVF